jgi:hypothetical protein
MADVSIVTLDPGRYGVEIRENAVSTVHRVTVPTELLDDLGLVGVDEERVVRESIEFLLEREPPTSIMDEFSLRDIARYFGDDYEELQRRLGA